LIGRAIGDCFPKWQRRNALGGVYYRRSARGNF
jgi:hypothetical protein